jgi:uncharacterized protein with PQ loop repeat
MSLSDFFGAVMSFSFVSSYIPQIIKMLVTKKAHDVSVWTYGICIQGYVAGLIWLLLTGFQLWLFINFFVGLSLSLTVVWLWYRYREK